jgi:MoaA/NifB/PqqE/SkfB family radical SAM enzyme
MTGPGTVLRRALTLWSHRIHALPVVVLMPHSRCNCRCVMCDIWQANHDRREISRDDLERHIASFERLGVRWVVLSGGEPLMHANLWRLCEVLTARAIRISLLTTGLLLERHAAEVVATCDEVIVSLDGPREVHDRIRGVPNAFDRLAAGVRALRAARPGFRATGRSVLQRTNLEAFGSTIDAAHEAGLDRISFLAADVSSQAFNRATPWTMERAAGVAPGPDEAQRFAAHVEDVFVGHADDFASGFVAESPDGVRRIAQYFLALHGLADYPPPVCNAPWVSTVIEADGTVRPCFFHAPLGNIHEAGLDEILNGEGAVEFRRRLDVARDAVCRRCVCTLHLAPWQGSGPA